MDTPFESLVHAAARNNMRVIFTLTNGVSHEGVPIINNDNTVSVKTGKKGKRPGFPLQDVMAIRWAGRNESEDS